MKSYKSQSTEIPIELDMESSQTTVYRNANVIALPLKDGEPQFYGYDVEEYTKAEYESVLINQSRADIDYVAIMMGVDL